MASPGLLPKVFSPSPRRPSLTPKDSYDSTHSPHPSRPSSSASKVRPGKMGKRTKSHYNFNSGNDILGIVMLEVNRAEDLPKLKNSEYPNCCASRLFIHPSRLVTRTGWDMDPFAVISFGKKVFRTRVIRHSLNPVWDEKLLFHVRRYESTFNINFAVLDWDKLSSNDHVGDLQFPLSQLLTSVPKPDELTGIYPEEVANGDHDMPDFSLPIQTPKDKGWEANHSPVLTFRFVVRHS